MALCLVGDDDRGSVEYRGGEVKGQLRIAVLRAGDVIGAPYGCALIGFAVRFHDLSGTVAAVFTVQAGNLPDGGFLRIGLFLHAHPSCERCCGTDCKMCS